MKNYIFDALFLTIFPYSLFTPIYCTSNCDMQIINIASTQLSFTLILEPTHIMDFSIRMLQFEVEALYKLVWKENRIPECTEDIKELSQEDINTMFVPIPDFINSKKSQPAVVDKTTTHISWKAKDKTFTSIQRLTRNFVCIYYFSDYPFDTQVCYVNITITSKEMKSAVATPPSQIMTAPEFVITKFYSVHYEDKHTYYVSFVFHICRQSGQPILTIFIPSALLVILTWFPFWMDGTNLTPKMSVSVTALLALVAQMTIVQNKLPGVSYVKAIDIWMLACIIMVVCSLMATAAGNFFRWMKKNDVPVSKPIRLRVLTKDDIRQLKNKPLPNEKRTGFTSRLPFPYKTSVRKRPSLPSTRFSQICQLVTQSVNGVDAVCRFLFPLAFFTFVIIYFLVYYRNCIVSE